MAEAKKKKYNNPVTATITGISDLFKKHEPAGLLRPADRLDGKTVLVDGSSSGLGYAVAVDVARRGARLIMACRSGIPGKGEKVKKISGNPDVHMLPVDFSDTGSIRSLVTGIHDQFGQIDILICNAGIVPKQSRKTPQGLEEMFMVNYFSKFIFVNLLVESGCFGGIERDVLKGGTDGNAGNPPEGADSDRWNDALTGKEGASDLSQNSDDMDIRQRQNEGGQSLHAVKQPGHKGGIPRIIFVASESHRNPENFDWSAFGKYRDYSIGKSIELYGYYKLLLTTFSVELSRRLNKINPASISVFPMCPGPVNSNIAREAPKVFHPLLKLVFGIFFKSPARAAIPVVYLAASPDQEGKSFDYLFLMSRKEVDDKASDPENGRRLWSLSEKLWKSL